MKLCWLTDTKQFVDPEQLSNERLQCLNLKEIPGDACPHLAALKAKSACNLPVQILVGHLTGDVKDHQTSMGPVVVAGVQAVKAVLSSSVPYVCSMQHAYSLRDYPVSRVAQDELWWSCAAE